MPTAVRFPSLALFILSIATSSIVLSGCSEKKEHSRSYAIVAEFARDSNRHMKDNLNRRVFDTVMSSEGKDITLEKDGSVTLEPGTYHINGYSLVTTQVTMAPPVPNDSNNYPGYCLLYPKQFESDTTALSHNITVGSPATALNTTPSLFDIVYTVKERTTICLGHQVGKDLNGQVYLSVYEVGGIPSNYHIFAQMCVERM